MFSYKVQIFFFEILSQTMSIVQITYRRTFPLHEVFQRSVVSIRTPDGRILCIYTKFLHFKNKYYYTGT